MSRHKAEVFIRSVGWKGPLATAGNFPWTIPAVQALADISFAQPVTFLVGENGSGKSTILESMAVAAGFSLQGGTKNYRVTEGTESESELANRITLIHGSRREKGGFFLRAESFYNVASEADRLGLVHSGRSLHQQSHGEAFLAMVVDRFEHNWLYFLDEPESALSVQRQLALLVCINDLVKGGCQFIIATHSPILLAYPEAVIYEMDAHGIHQKSYLETAQYELTRDFINDPKHFIDKLLE